MYIAIDMGHTVSGPGSGAVGKINESIETRAVGKHLIDLFKKNKVAHDNVTVDYAKNTRESINNRVTKITSRHDVSVSIHFNAGGGIGAEIFTNGGIKHNTSVRILKNLEDLGFLAPSRKSRGIKNGDHLALCKTRAKTCMLIEVGFVDSLDADTYRNIGPKKVAEAIYAGLMNEKPKGEIELTEEVKLFIREEIQKAIKPSLSDNKNNNEHWVDEDVKALKSKGIELSDKRYNDLATRAEVISLINRINKVKL